MIKGCRDFLGGIHAEEAEKFKDTNEKIETTNGLIKSTSSLLYRFESIGFDYSHKNDKNLTYRDIEKVLILFRNAYTVNNFIYIKKLCLLIKGFIY